MSELLDLLDAVAGTEVVVVGDAMLDGWLSGPSHRLSREAPVPVVDVHVSTYACGGAANAAANLASLGGRVRFVSVVGDDDDGDLLRRVLEQAGVDTSDVLVEPGRRTPAKRRVSAGGHMVTRLDSGDSQPLSEATRRALAARLRARAATAAGLVVSDYDHGTLDGLVDVVAGLAHPCLVVDSRQPRRWARARPLAVKPNWGEVAPLLGPGLDRAERVVAAGDAVRDALGARVATVTLDRDGAVVLSDGEPVRLYATPEPDAQAAGAGDSFTAALALGLAAGAAPALAAALAQRAAQVVVARPGTTPCGAGELRAALAGGGSSRLPDLDRLADCVAAHRAAGRTIAFTNGCFDVLHAGHVAHLREARSLADVLVVGLNSDASVARLLGPGRPQNPVADRSAVLAAVADVDHLVVFEGDTPADLLEVVRPDVYVKGGDYTPGMLPETPLVERLGGRVHILSYVDERSGLADPTSAP